MNNDPVQRNGRLFDPDFPRTKRELRDLLFNWLPTQRDTYTVKQKASSGGGGGTDTNPKVWGRDFDGAAYSGTTYHGAYDSKVLDFTIERGAVVTFTFVANIDIEADDADWDEAYGGTSNDIVSYLQVFRMSGAPDLKYYVSRDTSTFRTSRELDYMHQGGGVSADPADGQTLSGTYSTTVGAAQWTRDPGEASEKHFQSGVTVYLPAGDYRCKAYYFRPRSTTSKTATFQNIRAIVTAVEFPA